jgi:hypothetical protein
MAGSPTDPLAKLNQLDELIALGTKSVRHGEGQSPQGPSSPRQTPCSGPSCSNSPPLPPSTTAPSSDGRDRWVALNIAFVVDGTPGFDRMVDEPGTSPAGEKSSIFHPPRG